LAPLSETPSPSPSCSPASATEACRPSLSSATSVPSMLDPTAGELTSWLADFHARSTAAHLEDAAWLKTSGRNSSGSWQMPLLGLSLPRTSHAKLSTPRPTISKRWATLPLAYRSPRRTWVLITFGSGTGYLHTPTCTANYSAPSMQKWPSAREFTRVFGRPTPTNHEWLMDWPIGWTDLKPLEMGKFQAWQQQHSPLSLQSLSEPA
jgi:hypothetical protein